MGLFADLLRRFGRLADPGPPGKRAGIVDYLNIRRPQRARRLFTALFDPLLAADDPVLLRAPQPLPGLVCRADLAGLWAALEVFALTELTAAVQSALDRRAADTLLDDVLKSPEALAGQRRMRDAAVQVLDAQLSGDHDLSAFLDLLNRERLAEVGRLVPGLAGPAPLGRPFLVFVRDYLAVAERCAGPLAACAAGVEGDADRLVHAAETLQRELTPGLQRPGAGPELAHLVPLAALHAGRQYGAVALMLRDHGRAPPVAAALLGHFSACCALLGERVTAGGGDSDGALARLTLILPALIVAGLLDDRESGPEIRTEMRRLAGMLTVGLDAAPVPAPELLRLACGWFQLARTYDQEAGALGERLDALKEKVEW
ncbi:MAG: hypothetical protein WCJ64_18410 [Rhodospirillaceae bacterium]